VGCDLDGLDHPVQARDLDKLDQPGAAPVISTGSITR
jgi:hypothetical protein